MFVWRRVMFLVIAFIVRRLGLSIVVGGRMEGRGGMEDGGRKGV